MVRSIFVFLYLLFVVIAHSFFSDLDYSGFSWLPDEVSSFFSSPDDSGEADSYSFDPSVYNSQNDWEVSCTFNFVDFHSSSKSHPSGLRSAGFVRLGAATRQWICLECAAFSHRGDRQLRWWIFWSRSISIRRTWSLAHDTVYRRPMHSWKFNFSEWCDVSLRAPVWQR